MFTFENIILKQAFIEGSIGWDKDTNLSWMKELLTDFRNKGAYEETKDDEAQTKAKNEIYDDFLRLEYNRAVTKNDKEKVPEL